MPTSSAGKTTSAPACAPPLAPARGSVSLRGVTLIEMLVVVALISLMVGISYPAITSGIDSLRLKGATNGLVSFINAGLSRAERRQQVVEVTISKQDNSLEMQSVVPGFFRKMQLPEGITITHILPELPGDPVPTRTFLLYPGGTAPPLGVQVMNRRNVERVVRVDPITGVPQVEAPPEAAP
ncbi:MAG TPA: prepilin-type N-terminal cleavage/methylation domain-containing protein [Bryobacteraceae bacterium]|nr:prepilin-type N-terminal cleavage/methylation domain-containing protein [Bryobacteraceae bacterium]HUO32252.1 prepilin-type N-terminal cleavage/methylation domain-containing protein [Bryobacteraceae bacterium]